MGTCRHCQPPSYPTKLCDGALSRTFMTSYDYTSFLKYTRCTSFLRIPKWFMKNSSTYLFSVCTAPLLRSPSERKRLSYKDAPGEIIDLHLFIRGEAAHLPPVRPRRGSQRCHRARLSFLRWALNHGQGLQSVPTLPRVLFTASARQ